MCCANFTFYPGLYHKLLGAEHQAILNPLLHSSVDFMHRKETYKERCFGAALGGGNFGEKRDEILEPHSVKFSCFFQYNGWNQDSASLLIFKALIRLFWGITALDSFHGPTEAFLYWCDHILLPDSLVNPQTHVYASVFFQWGCSVTQFFLKLPLSFQNACLGPSSAVLRNTTGKVQVLSLTGKVISLNEPSEGILINWASFNLLPPLVGLQIIQTIFQRTLPSLTQTYYREFKMREITRFGGSSVRPVKV